MNKKIFIFLLSIVALASIATASIAASKSILPILPQQKVIHVEAKFTGEQAIIRNAVCEADKSLDPESERCIIMSGNVVYKGEIVGFVKGTWLAYGRVIKDRTTGYGYTEGTISIFGENGKLYKGKFQGAMQMLPIIADTTQQTDIVPIPAVWKIKGSMDLVGGSEAAGRKVFANFDAEQSRVNGKGTVAGSMDGVLVFNKLMPIPAPTPEPTTTTV